MKSLSRGDTSTGLLKGPRQNVFHVISQKERIDNRRRIDYQIKTGFLEADETAFRKIFQIPRSSILLIRYLPVNFCSVVVCRRC